MRVDRLETWAGPGQAEAFAASQQQLRAELAKIQRTQDQHSRMLTVLASDVAELKADVAELKAEVAELKADVAELKADVAELKADVAELKADVAELKADVAELKGMMREVLARLPAGPGAGVTDR